MSGRLTVPHSLGWMISKEKSPKRPRKSEERQRENVEWFSHMYQADERRRCSSWFLWLEYSLTASICKSRYNPAIWKFKWEGWSIIEFTDFVLKVCSRQSINKFWIINLGLDMLVYILSKAAGVVHVHVLGSSILERIKHIFIHAWMLWPCMHIPELDQQQARSRDSHSFSLFLA